MLILWWVWFCGDQRNAATLGCKSCLIFCGIFYKAVEIFQNNQSLFSIRFGTQQQKICHRGHSVCSCRISSNLALSLYLICLENWGLFITCLSRILWLLTCIFCLFFMMKKPGCTLEIHNTCMKYDSVAHWFPQFTSPLKSSTFYGIYALLANHILDF